MGGARILRTIAVAVFLTLAASAAIASGALATTPGWECVPTTAGQAVVSGGTGVAPSCGAGSTAVLAPTYVASGVGGKPTVEFSAVNVQIVSGSGSTSGTVNGEGNLIIGYDETPKAQTGSHNLVLGVGQSYTSFGSIVAGSYNSAGGKFSDVFGNENKAPGYSAVVAGGRGNVAEGAYSSVGGGVKGKSKGEYASVSGGKGNIAAGESASVAGGREGDASGEASAVDGGSNDIASDAFAWLGGGVDNQASGFGSAVSGGTGMEAAGTYSSVAGGSEGEAAGEGSSVLGGERSIARGVESVVLGGSFGTAEANFSVVLGGDDTFINNSKEYEVAPK
jgi:hypothetical protein